MKSNVFLLLLLLFSSTSTLWAVGPVVLADSEAHELQSLIIGEKLYIDVFFPKGYRERKVKARLPTIYITDADYNFGGVTYIARRLMKNKDIPEVLLVGIRYGKGYDDYYQKRARDLTPTARPLKGFKETGQANRFIHFMETELFPFVEDKLHGDPDQRVLYGHSFGGLFGLYVYLSRPVLFQRIIALSPSIWFDRKLMDNLVLSVPEEKWKTMPILYTAVGSEEPTSFVNDWKHLVASLKGKLPKGGNMRAEELIRENHRSIFGVSYTNGMRFVFSLLSDGRMGE